MINQVNEIPVFFSTDDQYAPFLSVALISLRENADRAYQYRIFILYLTLSKQNQEKLSALNTEWFHLEFVSMMNRLDSIAEEKSNVLRADYFTLTIFFRLFIPVMFPEYKKGIYLDSDIVVLGNISEFYHLELGDDLIGAVPDYSVADIPKLTKYIESGIGIDKHSYINSGILLMNLEKLRKVCLDQRFLTLLHTYHFDCIAPDQDYLNAMCNGKISYLPHIWDAMPMDGKEPLKNPQIIHYNLFLKPWCYDQVPYDEYFWLYAKASVYYPQILKNKAEYGEKERESDNRHLQLLLSRAELIADAKENFRTVFNEGKESRL